jgi:hypothetical protein
VDDAVQTLNGRLRRTLSFAATSICCLALLGGCGGSSHSSTIATHGVGESLELASCSDWRKGTEAQRRRTVVELREFAGGQVGSSVGIQRGPVLRDSSAYKLLQSWCRNYFARGFKLYKLYTRSAAFGGH